MMTLKSVGAFAVIIGCFAVVYPRFLHPLVLRAFGMNPSGLKDDDSHFPPYMRQSKQSPTDRRPPPMPHDPKDIRQHIRPGPHPGMRAAAEMQKQAQGSGRGMMGIVLPMYAIGISVYLIYTLFKVFNKRAKCTDQYSKRHSENEGEAPQFDRLGFPKGLRGTDGGHDYGDGEVRRFLQKKQQERELEDLLLKMDDSQNVSEDEMQALQKRLEETEAQMTRILQAMQVMQSRVGTMGQAGEEEAGDRAMADEDTNEKASEKMETVGPAAPSPSSSEESQKASEEAQSRTSSPDTESYEIVKNSASAINDTSPVSEMSSPSSFEQIHKTEEMDQEMAVGKESEEEGGSDELLLDQQKEEESSVRQRKTGHAEED